MSPITNLLLFLLWAPDLGFIWETCQSAKCSMEQGRAENSKSAIQNSRRLLPLIVNGKSFKSQHCSRLHKYVNGFFSSENIYVSFIGAKAKTRVTESLGRNWARLAVMDGLVPFDPPDEHTSAHAGMIKELLDMRDVINDCLHLSRTEIDDLINRLCCEW